MGRRRANPERERDHSRQGEARSFSQLTPRVPEVSQHDLSCKSGRGCIVPGLRTVQFKGQRFDTENRDLKQVKIAKPCPEPRQIVQKRTLCLLIEIRLCLDLW
jgi:hypothetical protein